MCGIVGYTGGSEAVDILVDGLRRLEYRGYDSAGIATARNGDFDLRKRAGRIDGLAETLKEDPPKGQCGISHTRWATHGKPTDANAHPHLDGSGRLALVHNGVIENYQELREELTGQGHVFHSETDSEVLAHLIGRQYDALGGDPSPDRLLQAMREGLSTVLGTYGVVVCHLDLPGQLVGARRGSPLVLGIGEGEHFLASDVAAVVAYTQDVVYLRDYDLVVVRPDGFEISTLQGGSGRFEVSRVEYTADDVDKGEYPHFMLKEIFEQPETVRDAMRGRLAMEEATARLGGLNMTTKELRGVDRIILTGCGTALHAARVGEYLLEGLARIPIEVECASEFRYRNMPLYKDTILMAISQSGETADTLAAMREAQRKGLRALGICNNVSSTIARESDGGVFMHAGPEIGVAATKSFTSQLVILTLLALLMGRIRLLSTGDGIAILRELEALPDKIRKVLELNDSIRGIAQKYASSTGMLFMGRQYQYPVALEGALKMKEISYLFAEGHPSAELKHGVIALIKPELPSVFIAPEDAVLEKNISNIEEVKARKGPVIAIGTEGNTTLAKVADDVILVPPAPDYLAPVLTTIPLQLLAYHLADTLGCDIDKPRNLAKSVTVE